MTQETMTKGGPVHMPPVGDEAKAGTNSGSGSAPSTLMEEPGLTGADVESGPSLLPPQAIRSTAVGEDGVTASWHNGVKVDALWSIDETRNAWVRIVGVGWKRIYNGRDGAFQALVTLASQARQTGRPINVREETGGIIHEIYLW